MTSFPPQSPRDRTASVLGNSNISPSPLSRRTSLMSAASPNAAAAASSDEPPVPMRHPRPLTAAELHLELEKEQEAVVNRLQRELSQLRAQTASVASNASSASSSSAVFDTTPTNAEPATPNTIYPTTSRRHRSSSSLSIRSAQALQAGERTSQASVDRARDAGMGVLGTGGRSRQNSHSTSLAPPGQQISSVNMPAPPRERGMGSLSRQPSTSLSPAAYGHGGTAYFGATSPGTRVEETSQARVALESARRENEKLAARVRELEAALREKEKSRREGATAVPASIA